MLCQKCHKNLATVRYAEVVDGQVTDQQLCRDCLACLQEDSGAGFDIAGSKPVVHQKPSASEVASEVVKTQRTCRTCGTALSTVLDEATVGCATCYETFGSQIESVLEGLHRALWHKGKVSRMDDARARLRADLQAKRALLRSVLRAENYEEAARLRDEIRGLEAGLHVSETGAD